MKAARITSLILLFALSSCDDEPSASDPDTAVLEDTSNPSDLDAADVEFSDCCEKISCLNAAQTCNPRTCQCEDAGIDTSDPPDTSSDADTSSDPECILFTETPCPSGDTCRATRRDAESGALVGECVAVEGSAELGEGCVVTGCGAGLECVDDICEAHCDPDATPGSGEPGACPVDRACIPLLRSNGTRSVEGACLETCTPWALFDGCANGEWCFPAYFVRDAGVCQSSSGPAVGESCSSSGGCGEDALCFGGVCDPICDPRAGAGESGACTAANARCLPVALSGLTLVFGHCSVTCDPIAQDCPGSGEYCYFAELGETGSPECAVPPADLIAGTSCSDAGLDRLDACGPNRFCIDDVCTQLCVVESTGDFGQANPGCPANTVCNRLGTAPNVGQCE